jgi:hypothetical protein
MARFAKGTNALMISDRSGAAFPYREMVQEWNGLWVHTSEYEPKQPQIDPRPVGADPQALQHAKPARVEFPVQNILPENPFTTASNTTLSISFPNNAFNQGTTYVRFSDVKQPVGGVAITTLELSTTLNGDLTDSATSIVLTDGSAFPTAGYIVIEKVNSETGAYENETIKYTGRSTHTLTGCTRGSSAPYRGVTPTSTSAGTHSSGAKVYGSYLATAIGTTVIVGPKASQTETHYNSLTVPLVSAASSTATGGGFNCTIGPVNDRG